MFYCPNKEEKEELQVLFNKIGSKANNTTEQGDQLRLFFQYLLRLTKVFESANMRTATNEIDCLVKNKLKFQPSFLGQIGSTFIVECKNEQKKPDNGYFYKLEGLVRRGNLSLGVMVSMQEAGKVFKDLCKNSYLKDKIYIINIIYKDLINVVENKVNFLTLLENKLLEIDLDITTDLNCNKKFTV